MHISSIKNTVSACCQVRMSIMSPYLYLIGDIVCNHQCIHNLSERQEHLVSLLKKSDRVWRSTNLQKVKLPCMTVTEHTLPLCLKRIHKVIVS